VTVVVWVADTVWLDCRPSEQSSVYEAPPPVMPALAVTGARQTKAAAAQDASFKNLDKLDPREKNTGRRRYGELSPAASQKRTSLDGMSRPPPVSDVRGSFGALAEIPNTDARRLLA
jgi:hypothetical protein